MSCEAGPRYILAGTRTPSLVGVPRHPYYGQLGAAEDRGRVAPVDYSPRAPTDPYVPSRAYGSSGHKLATVRYTEWIAAGGGSGKRPNSR